MNNMKNPDSKIEPKLKWVDLITFDATTLKETITAHCILENGVIRFEGNPKSIEGMPEKLLLDGKIVSQADGEEYLRALGHEYRSAYFLASDINEGDVITTPKTLPPQDV